MRAGWGVSTMAGLLLLSACRSPASNGPAMPLTESLLALGPSTARTAGLAEIDRVAAQIMTVLAAQIVRDPARAFNQVVFSDLGFSREVDDKDLRFSLLGSVLGSRRGGCVGLGTLYLALGERLQIPVEGILVPGHFFVRIPGPTGVPRNVELLRQGEAMPDDWYRSKYGVSNPTPSAYLRPLSASEVLAVVHFNSGNDARLRGRLHGARDSYGQAVSGFPSFAEAQASLGLARQLLGDLQGADSAYNAALRLQADLPGLGRNLEILRQQQQSPSGLPR